MKQRKWVSVTVVAALSTACLCAAPALAVADWCKPSGNECPKGGGGKAPEGPAKPENPKAEPGGTTKPENPKGPKEHEREKPAGAPGRCNRGEADHTTISSSGKFDAGISAKMAPGGGSIEVHSPSTVEIVRWCEKLDSNGKPRRTKLPPAPAGYIDLPD